MLFDILVHVELLHTKTPLLDGDDVNEKREEIREVSDTMHSLLEGSFIHRANSEGPRSTASIRAEQSNG